MMTRFEKKALGQWRSERTRRQGSGQVRNLAQARAYDSAHGLSFSYSRRNKRVEWGTALTEQAVAAVATTPARRVVQTTISLSRLSLRALREEVAKKAGVNPETSRLHRWSNNFFSLFAKRENGYIEYPVYINANVITIDYMTALILTSLQEAM